MSPDPESFHTAWIDLWLRRHGRIPKQVLPLTGDVSPRRYARIRLAQGDSVILALYPSEIRPTCQRFLDTSRLLGGNQIPVPAVEASDCSAGLMLLEDVGEHSLFDLRTQPWSVLRPYLKTAVQVIQRIATLPGAEVGRLNPPLNESLLSREIHQTWENFLRPQNLTGSSLRTESLAKALATICEKLGQESPVPCHRDFMARNLIPQSGGAGLVVLDHQDLRLGPPGYDLASLLNDSLFPPWNVEAEVIAGLGLTSRKRLSYHRAAAQRTLKAIGTFVAFAQRGSDRHLSLVPATLARSLHHLSQLPEAREVVPGLRTLWHSVMEPWAGNQL